VDARHCRGESRSSNGARRLLAVASSASIGSGAKRRLSVACVGWGARGGHGEQLLGVGCAQIQEGKGVDSI
jgi:hypothetical protein